MPPGTPQEGPRKAQDSPRWAQDGLDKVPKIPREALTPPLDLIKASRGHLQPILRPSWAILGRLPICAYACARARGTRPRRCAARQSNSARYSWSSPGPILVRSWPIFGPTFVNLGTTSPFRTNLQADMDSKLPSSSHQDQHKTSKQPLCKHSQGSLPGGIGQKTLIFTWFLKGFATQPFNHNSCQPPPS